MKLIDIIRNDIANNTIVDDGKLPTLRQLAARYQCGTTSVKRAFDTLENDGIIRVVRGQGNFVIGHKDSPKQKKSKLIGTILLNGSFMSELAAVRDEYLEQGWIFSMYDASFDHQSPEKEKLFLKNAMKQNFSSFIITASPIEPVNTELFMQLRANGCKVIHLTKKTCPMNVFSVPTTPMPQVWLSGKSPPQVTKIFSISAEKILLRMLNCLKKVCTQHLQIQA